MNGDTGSAAGGGWQVDRGCWADMQEEEQQQPNNVNAPPAAECTAPQEPDADADGGDGWTQKPGAGADHWGGHAWTQEPAQGSWQEAPSASGSASWSWTHGSWQEAPSAGWLAGAKSARPVPFNPWGSHGGRPIRMRCRFCNRGMAPPGCKFDACLGCCPKDDGSMICHRHMF